MNYFELDDDISKYGKTVYCHGDTVHVKTEIAPTDDDVILERGKTIISARTRTDLAAQLSAVTANGWDMKKCTGFTATAWKARKAGSWM